MKKETGRYTDQVLKDKWVVGPLIGEGSNGKTEVYEISHHEPGLDEQRALKITEVARGFNNGKSEDDLRRDANRELDLMNKLESIHTMSYLDHWYDHDKDDPRRLDLFVVMKELDTLTNYRGKKFSEKEIAKIGIDICDALEECERKNVVHRDIKPANIYISGEGKHKLQYILGDFGISRIIANNSSSYETSSFLTPGFAAPEQYDPYPNLDKEVDIYSLGLTLYYLANGWKSPFMEQPGPLDQAADQKRIQTDQLPEIPGISQALNAILLKATRRKKEERYQSARDMEQALKGVFNTNPSYETIPAKSGYETAAANPSPFATAPAGAVSSYETQAANGGESQTAGSYETQAANGGKIQTVGSYETQAANGGESQTAGSYETQAANGGESQTADSYETQAVNGAETAERPVYSTDTMTATRNAGQSRTVHSDIDAHGLYLSQKRELMEIAIDGPQVGNLTFENLHLEIAEGALAVVFGTDFSTISTFSQVISNCIAGRGDPGCTISIYRSGKPAKAWIAQTSYGTLNRNTSSVIDPELLKLLRLTKLKDKSYFDMTPLEQVLLAIARTLTTELPVFLYIDCYDLGIDKLSVDMKTELFQILEDVAHKLNLTILVINYGVPNSKSIDFFDQVMVLRHQQQIIKRGLFGHKKITVSTVDLAFSGTPKSVAADAGISNFEDIMSLI
ncbi:MAG: protein kinase [Lactobacillus porci]|nr:protein kinase [Lactobacillus porci]